MKNNESKYLPENLIYNYFKLLDGIIEKMDLKPIDKISLKVAVKKYKSKLNNAKAYVGSGEYSEIMKLLLSHNIYEKGKRIILEEELISILTGLDKEQIKIYKFSELDRYYGAEMECIDNCDKVYVSEIIRSILENCRILQNQILEQRINQREEQNYKEYKNKQKIKEMKKISRLGKKMVIFNKDDVALLYEISADVIELLLMEGKKVAEYRNSYLSSSNYFLTKIRKVQSRKNIEYKDTIYYAAGIETISDLLKFYEKARKNVVKQINKLEYLSFPEELEPEFASRDVIDALRDSMPIINCPLELDYILSEIKANIIANYNHHLFYTFKEVQYDRISDIELSPYQQHFEKLCSGFTIEETKALFEKLKKDFYKKISDECPTNKNYALHNELSKAGYRNLTDEILQKTIKLNIGTLETIFNKIIEQKENNSNIATKNNGKAK